MGPLCSAGTTVVPSGEQQSNGEASAVQAHGAAGIQPLQRVETSTLLQLIIPLPQKNGEWMWVDVP